MQNSTTCDSQIIQRFIADQLNENEVTAFEHHLGQCKSCCRQLNELTAEPSLWNEAKSIFQSASQDWLTVAGLVDDDAESADKEPLASEMLRLDFLNATDDPQMLGRFGGYEISGVIGCGGMGIVLKGFDRTLNRFAAIKVLSPHYAGNPAARKRFAREARAAAAVVHENVMAIHGVDKFNKLPYLVMPYIKGVSLQKRIDHEQSLTVTEILRIATQTASGLAAAHDQGIVHRDVKPANILLPENVERVLLTDFGLARAADDASMTRSGVIAGTPQYMSPEQARGEALDVRSDLFSLGSVIYAMCVGRPPFRAETPYGILRKITDDSPRPIREINPDIPDWLCGIVERLHSKQPADRFQSAEEVAEVLSDCLAHVQQPQTVPLPNSVRRKNRFRKKGRGSLLVLTILGLFVCFQFGGGILGGFTDSQPVGYAESQPFESRSNATEEDNQHAVALGSPPENSPATQASPDPKPEATAEAPKTEAALPNSKTVARFPTPESVLKHLEIYSKKRDHASWVYLLNDSATKQYAGMLAKTMTLATRSSKIGDLDLRRQYDDGFKQMTSVFETFARKRTGEFHNGFFFATGSGISPSVIFDKTVQLEELDRIGDDFKNPRDFATKMATAIDMLPLEQKVEVSPNWRIQRTADKAIAVNESTSANNPMRTIRLEQLDGDWKVTSLFENDLPKPFVARLVALETAYDNFQQALKGNIQFAKSIRVGHQSPRAGDVYSGSQIEKQRKDIKHWSKDFSRRMAIEIASIKADDTDRFVAALPLLTVANELSRIADPACRNEMRLIGRNVFHIAARTESSKSKTAHAAAHSAPVLELLARTTGQIPESLCEQWPRVAATQKKLELLRKMLKNKADLNWIRQEQKQLTGLLDEAPFRAMKAILRPELDFEPFDPAAYLQAWLVCLSHDNMNALHQRENKPITTLDSILAVTILESLVGKSEEQDDRISLLFATRDPSLSPSLPRDLDQILTGNAAYRPTVKLSLAEIYRKSKSKKLKEAIAKVAPGIPVYADELELLIALNHSNGKVVHVNNAQEIPRDANSIERLLAINDEIMVSGSTRNHFITLYESTDRRSMSEKLAELTSRHPKLAALRFQDEPHLILSAGNDLTSPGIALAVAEAVDECTDTAAWSWLKESAKETPVTELDDDGDINLGFSSDGPHGVQQCVRDGMKECESIRIGESYGKWLLKSRVSTNLISLLPEYDRDRVAEVIIAFGKKHGVRFHDQNKTIQLTCTPSQSRELTIEILKAISKSIDRSTIDLR